MHKKGYHRIQVKTTEFVVPVRYQCLSPIGSGTYAEVCSAVNNENGKKVAIKKLSDPFESATTAKFTYREISLLKHMKNENIIGLLDLFTSGTSFDTYSDVYLVTQLMDADLYKLLRNKQSFSIEHIKFFVYQILRGLKYAHSAGIIHRDLKPGNLAVNENCDLKILDFGLARVVDRTMTMCITTQWYRAPEVILDCEHYNTSIDIWSVGCIMAELITGDVLFPGNDLVDQIDIIMNLVGTPSAEFVKNLTNDEARNHINSLTMQSKQDFATVFSGKNRQAVDLLDQMLNIDPNKRITADEALAHSFLHPFSDPTDEPTSEPYKKPFEEENFECLTWKQLVWEECKNFKPPSEDTSV